MRRIFLLGGHDLEMQEIKNLLKSHGERYVDAHLNWGNARLSAYMSVISEEPNSEYYGIELKEDTQLPKYYHRIDHHNDYNQRPAAIMQVAEILGIKPGRHIQLVAANDAGYIPAMRALNASKEEIAEIRKQDRAAQGVTEEDEKMAEIAVASADKSYPGLIVVKASRSRFSPIVDRLTDLHPFCSYLVHTYTTICAYGPIASAFKDYYHESKELYYGGTGDGYAGLSDVKEATIEQIIKQVKKMKPISKHIFLFPFKFKGNIELNEILWKRVINPDNEKEKASIFNEKQYFYPFVHKALYDNGTGTTLIRHYERAMEGGKYAITVDKKIYVLDIESICVNFYDFGLGVVSFHLLNTDTNQSAPDDILKINQYGRRIMPPFFKDITNNPRKELADKIQITWEGGNYIEEDFMNFTPNEAWIPGSIVKELLKPLDITPVIDDRMFTLCYYENNEEISRIARARPQSSNFCRKCLNNESKCKDFWYKYVFVDGGEDATCYGDDMYHKLLSEQTYTRWEHPLWGTEYGVSKYSLVALTTETAPPFLLDYFETIYTRLTELVLCQRAGLVLFSGKTRDLASNFAKPMDVTTENTLINNSTVLSNDYIQFVNNFCYQEVTAQDQGFELYTLLKSTLNTDRFEATLREQILQLHNRIQDIYNQKSQDSNEKRERYSFMLNKLAGAIIPITILASLAGLLQLWEHKFEWYWVLIFTIGVIVGGIIGGCLLLLFISRKNN